MDQNATLVPNSQDIVEMVLNFNNNEPIDENQNRLSMDPRSMYYPNLSEPTEEVLIEEELQNFAQDILMGTPAQQYQDVKPVIDPQFWLMSVVNSTVVNQTLKSCPGEYGFKVSLEQQEKVSKTMTWTYSNEVGRLYVMLNTQCPFKISTAIPPPENSYVVCVAAFKDAVSRRENVVRCPHHCRNQDTGNGSSKFWMTCNHNQTIYHEDIQNNRRHCLIVPYEKPHVGCTNYTYLLEFKCRNTCVGGVNRRSTEVIFLLQHEGKELGRSVVEVKVCACPGRDRRHDEMTLAKRLSLETSKFKSQNSSGHSKLSKIHSQDLLNLSNATDDHEATSEEWFTIKVKGKANYEILKRVAEGLELRSNQKMKKRKLVDANKNQASTNQVEMRREIDIVYSDG